MSIANYSVVGRILAEVEQRPSPPELGPRERLDGPGQLFELRRSRCIHEAPFATPLHFWAHALRGLLEEQRRLDLFEAMATHALCRREEGAMAGAALRELAARVDATAPVPPGSRFGVAYRMIDQDVMASWVAVGQGEALAFFWLRVDWLANALPWDPEEEDPDVGGDAGGEHAEP